MKAGDIIRQKAHHKWDFFHVTYADKNGALDVICDSDGKFYGLSANFCQPSNLAELLADREARSNGHWTPIES